MTAPIRQSLRQSLLGMSTEERSFRRQSIFLEILDTETNYINDLQLVIEVRTLDLPRRGQFNGIGHFHGLEWANLLVKAHKHTTSRPSLSPGVTVWTDKNVCVFGNYARACVCCDVCAVVCCVVALHELPDFDMIQSTFWSPSEGGRCWTRR
jgi:hypothetical protein